MLPKDRAGGAPVALIIVHVTPSYSHVPPSTELGPVWPPNITVTRRVGSYVMNWPYRPPGFVGVDITFQSIPSYSQVWSFKVFTLLFSTPPNKTMRERFQS
jgi:hypothetical protein